MEKAFLFFSGLTAAFCFFAVAALFALRGRHSLSTALFTLALSLTGLWALALTKSGDTDWGRYPAIVAACRDAGWFATILVFLRQESERHSLSQKLAVAAAALILINLAFAVSGSAFINGPGLRLNLATVQLAIPIMGLILVENLLLNLEASRRWSVRLMAIGLSALFGYNIVLRIPQFLGGEPIDAFVAAQPLVYLTALPLLVVTGIRNNSLKVQAHSSRNVVFHSATLIFAGNPVAGSRNRGILCALVRWCAGERTRYCAWIFEF